MTKAKKLIILEVVYELVAKIHTDLCHTVGRDNPNNVIDDTTEILRQILILSKKIKGLKEVKND